MTADNRLAIIRAAGRVHEVPHFLLPMNCAELEAWVAATFEQVPPPTDRAEVLRKYMQ